MQGHFIAEVTDWVALQVASRVSAETLLLVRYHAPGDALDCICWGQRGRSINASVVKEEKSPMSYSSQGRAKKGFRQYSIYFVVVGLGSLGSFIPFPAEYGAEGVPHLPDAVPTLVVWLGI